MHTYIKKLHPSKDEYGSVRQVEVVFDEVTKTYVGTIWESVSERPLSRRVVGLGECISPSGAADQAILNYEARKKENV